MRRHCFSVLLCTSLALAPRAFADSSNGNAGGVSGNSGNPGGNSNAGGSGNGSSGGGNAGGSSGNPGGNGNAGGAGSSGGDSNAGNNVGGSGNSTSAGSPGNAAASSAYDGRGHSDKGSGSAASLSSGSSTKSGAVANEQDTTRTRSSDVDTRPSAWGTTSARAAREAVAQGAALPLSAILPTVSKRVPGQVLEVDLRQSPTGAWQYELLVLTNDRRYQVVIVDAKLNQVTHVRSR